MRLITGPLSMFGRKVEIALAEKRLDHDLGTVPFSLETFYAPTHPDVARINPKRQVPVLQDGDLEIFDSTLIFDYLDVAYPEFQLWPEAPRDRARAKLTELKADEVFFPAVQMFMPHKASGFDDTARTKSARIIQTQYAEWDAQLRASNAYLHDSFGYADIAVFVAQHFATFLGHGPNDELSDFLSWKTRMLTRTSVARVVDEIGMFLAQAAQR